MELKPHYFNISLFFKFIKSSELAIFLLYLLKYLIYSSEKSLFLCLIIIFNSSLNYFIKHKIALPLFNLNNGMLPIFGQGKRPEGATNCGYFDSCPETKASSYGFPSGHSQFAGLVSGFLINDIIKTKSTNGKVSGLKKGDRFSIIILLSYVPIMMFSRIFIEKCHTIEQTIFGALIGLFLGFKSNDVYRY